MTIPLLLAVGLARACAAGSAAPLDLVVVDLASFSPERLEEEFDFAASSAAVFDGAVAQADRPAPALASLLTSEYPRAHGVLGPDARLSTAAAVLPEVLERAGYATAAFEAGAPPASGLARGFGTWQDEATAARAADAARRWLAAGPREPFFLFVRLEGSASAAPALALWKDLARGGFLPRAVILLVAESGGARSGGLDDGVLKVPFVVLAPGVLAHRVAKIVSAIDAPPTALALLGLSSPLDFEGAERAALVRSTASVPDDSGWAFSAATSSGPSAEITAYSVRDAGWKLIYDRASGDFRLVDLKKDPRETEDASERHPERALALTQLLLRHIRETPAGPNERPRPVSPEMLRQLRVKGYW